MPPCQELTFGGATPYVPLRLEGEVTNTRSQSEANTIGLYIDDKMAR